MPQFANQTSTPPLDPVARQPISSTSSTNKFFHLGIRKDVNDREINIKLTGKALWLIVWIGLGFILLYEIISVMLTLLLKRRRWMERDEREERLPTKATATTITRSISSNSQPAPFILVLLWGITTLYAVFYSFEIVFMYVNDKWHQLLTMQFLFTLTDIFVWCWMIGKIKYRLWNATTVWAKSCLIIKFNHMLFNILVEQNTWSARNMMFFLEDVSCLAMAQAVFGVSLRSLAKSLVVSGVFTLVVVNILRFDGFRIT